MAEYRPEEMLPLSSDLTKEQRMENRFEWSGMVNRVAKRIRGLDLPLQRSANMMLMEYGWPAVLDELVKIAQKKRHRGCI